MPLRAVLFDFDGVIADTANVHIAAWERTFGRLGWDVPPEVCARSAEVDDEEFLTSLFASRSIEGDVHGWVALKQKLVTEMLADWPRIYPGVRGLISGLSDRAKLGVVSSAWTENILAVLKKAAWTDAFSVIVGKEDVRGLKPDPEPYLVALKRLGIQASEAVALEDSPRGLASARAAGITVVAVGHRRASGTWNEGSEYLESLENLPDVLRAIEVD